MVRFTTIDVGRLALLLVGVNAGPAPNTDLVARAATPPSALPQKATANDLKWQPFLDFDADGCYNVPAIDAQGNIANGLDHRWTGPSSNCRDLSDLNNNNVYSRQRCNGVWCVYLYDYYFEKDVAIPYSPITGHRHDWEHIAVWVRNGQAEYVGASQHGAYEIKPTDQVQWQGTHPKMVYRKDGFSTHNFRFGNADDEPVNNHKGVWFKGDLISWNGFPGNTRNLLSGHDFGKANFALKEASFKIQLERARPDGIEFDTRRDEGFPGNPSGLHAQGQKW